MAGPRPIEFSRKKGDFAGKISRSRVGKSADREVGYALSRGDREKGFKQALLGIYFGEKDAALQRDSDDTVGCGGVAFLIIARKQGVQIGIGNHEFSWVFKRDFGCGFVDLGFGILGFGCWDPVFRKDCKFFLAKTHRDWNDSFCPLYALHKNLIAAFIFSIHFPFLIHF